MNSDSSATTADAAADRLPTNLAGIDARRLVFIGNLSIFMVGLGLAVRANIAGDIQLDLFNEIELARSSAMTGSVLGSTFIGFALTLLFGSALVDHLGMKRMLLFSAMGHIMGSAVVVYASFTTPGDATYWMIYAGFLLTGLAWGAVQAASNPLVAALFPDEKTHRINVLHAWWPAGIVIGALIGLGLSAIGVPWQLNLLILVIPGVILAWKIWSSAFPVTERVAAGISHRDMYREVIRSPACLIWFVAMMFTATTQLAPGPWVEVSLTNMVGMPGIVVLIYVSGLIFVLRHFAGHIVRFITPVALLWWSCLTAALGLYLLSLVEGPLGAFAAATIWGVGVCYLYPTMVSSVAERYPRGGAFTMGIMGFSAALAVQFILPVMGALFDRARLDAAGGKQALQALSGPELDTVVRIASVQSFQVVAIIPLLMLPVFGAIWLQDRRRKQAV